MPPCCVLFWEGSRRQKTRRSTDLPGIGTAEQAEHSARRLRQSFCPALKQGRRPHKTKPSCRDRSAREDFPATTAPCGSYNRPVLHRKDGCRSDCAVSVWRLPAGFTAHNTFRTMEESPPKFRTLLTSSTRRRNKSRRVHGANFIPSGQIQSRKTDAADASFRRRKSRALRENISVADNGIMKTA